MLKTAVALLGDLASNLQGVGTLFVQKPHVANFVRECQSSSDASIGDAADWAHQVPSHSLPPFPRGKLSLQSSNRIHWQQADSVHQAHSRRSTSELMHTAISANATWLPEGRPVNADGQLAAHNLFPVLAFSR